MIVKALANDSLGWIMTRMIWRRVPYACSKKHMVNKTIGFQDVTFSFSESSIRCIGAVPRPHLKIETPFFCMLWLEKMDVKMTGDTLLLVEFHHMGQSAWHTYPEVQKFFKHNIQNRMNRDSKKFIYS